MAISSYASQRLAAVYDVLNPVAADDRFYLALAGHRPKDVLDVGAGTGRLACELAELGHAVTAVEPSVAMLAFARGRPGAERVRWICCDAAGLSLPESFDLIVMTGHAFQVFLSDEQVVAALTVLRRRLRPNGRLAFESRNPSAGAWRGWTAQRTRRRVHVPTLGAVEVFHEASSVEGAVIRYRTHFAFGNGETEVAEDAIRFSTELEIADLLRQAGLTVNASYGDWDGAPAGPAAQEIIVLSSPGLASRSCGGPLLDRTAPQLELGEGGG